MAAQNKSNEIKLHRLYDAPVEAVWDAWTDPAQVAQWWGPRGFTLTTHAKDLRPGGIWHYTMHGPDGTDWPNKTLYHEVEPYAKLVYDHGGNDIQEPLFHVTVLFKDVAGKTEFDMTMRLKTAEEAEQTRQFIKKAGGNSTWDRLAEYLAKEREGKERFVINRSFAAPVELVFDMFTQPEHLGRWMPPGGMDMAFLRTDVRPGGSNFYRMGNENITMYGRSEFVEISKPNRLVYRQQFVDADEKLSRHPMAPAWPATLLTTVEFVQEDAEHTRVTITAEPVGEVTAEELAVFTSARAGMTGGWTGSLDKLEALLAA